MSPYDVLAKSITRFTGKEISAGSLSCFDQIDIQDEGTFLRMQIYIDEETCQYTVNVSEFLDLSKNFLQTEELSEVEALFLEIAEALDKKFDGLKRLDRITGTLDECKEIPPITTNLNRLTSLFSIFLNGDNLTTRDPNEAALALEEYYYESMDKYIDLLNEKLPTYTNKTFVYGEDFEIYKDGVFLSIFFDSEKKIIITFHPGKNPNTFTGQVCANRREVNIALRQVLKRLQ